MIHATFCAMCRKRRTSLAGHCIVCDYRRVYGARPTWEKGAWIERGLEVAFVVVILGLGFFMTTFEMSRFR